MLRLVPPRRELRRKRLAERFGVTGQASGAGICESGPGFLSRDWHHGGMRWVIELEGGPAFPANAATACRIAASGKPVGYLAEVFMRLEAAVAAATTEDEPPVDDED